MESLRILRILDANLDRAREGLRVVEEWFRFGCEAGTPAAECKALRQELATWHSEAMRAARDTAHDPLTGIDHPAEGARLDARDLLVVNFARVQEALRVVEEYAKLSELALAQAAKHWRYRVYRLQSLALGDDRRQKLADARLYLVTSPHPDLLSVVDRALAAGLSLVQLRDKQAEGGPLLDLALRLRELTARHGALFIVNDRVDLALASEADGVHLGQTDLLLPVARRLAGPRLLLGLSTHSPTEAAQAQTLGADYIGVGPVFATPTKPGRPAAGLDYVRHACLDPGQPAFAIGGIDLDNLEEVLAAGATRIAVVRAIMAAADPGATTARFLEKLHAH